MKPNTPGTYEWIDNNGYLRYVEVVDVGVDTPWLRVPFKGGYYNVHDGCKGTWEEEFNKAEWPDRWGRRLGDLRCVPQELLYQ